jgi:hypothetical protein
MYHKRLQKPSYKGGVCVAHEVATTRCTTKDYKNQAIKEEFVLLMKWRRPDVPQKIAQTKL